VEVELGNAPMLYFDRLKMTEKAEALNAEAASQVPKEGTEAIPEKPEVQKDSSQREFMFVKAYEQCKDISLAMLRPKRPSGAEPHIAFEVIFTGEDVVGWSGPYKQFF